MNKKLIARIEFVVPAIRLEGLGFPKSSDPSSLLPAAMVIGFIFFKARIY